MYINSCRICMYHMKANCTATKKFCSGRSLFLREEAIITFPEWIWTLACIQHVCVAINHSFSILFSPTQGYGSLEPLPAIGTPEADDHRIYAEKSTFNRIWYIFPLQQQIMRRSEMSESSTFTGLWHWISRISKSFVCNPPDKKLNRWLLRQQRCNKKIRVSGEDSPLKRCRLSSLWSKTPNKWISVTSIWRGKHLF